MFYNRNNINSHRIRAWRTTLLHSKIVVGTLRIIRNLYRLIILNITSLMKSIMKQIHLQKNIYQSLPLNNSLISLESKVDRIKKEMKPLKTLSTLMDKPNWRKCSRIEIWSVKSRGRSKWLSNWIVLKKKTIVSRTDLCSLIRIRANRRSKTSWESSRTRSTAWRIDSRSLKLKCRTLLVKMCLMRMNEILMLSNHVSWRSIWMLSNKNKASTLRRTDQKIKL